MLGKRKRDHAAVSRKTLHGIEAKEATDTGHAIDLFREYFEAKFEPLPQKTSLPRLSNAEEDEVDEESQSETSDWSGFTENDARMEEVRVIEHAVMPEASGESGASEGKYFMSSKPPLAGKTATATKPVARQADLEEEVTDAANLKKDLALQRLLKESHLLHRPSSTSTSAPTVKRDKVTDLRMQSLGAKASLFDQQKMPLSHRRGIKAKAATREAVRRKEAQENGVVLERASKGKQGEEARKRDRGIGAPAVGRFSGGMLTLSRKDIHEINGPRQPVRGGKRRGKR